MVNPWIWYIVNDEMPSRLSASGRTLTIFGIWFILLILLAVGLLYIAEYVIGYSNSNFMLYYSFMFFISIGVFIGLSLWLLPKALHKWG